MNPRLRPSVAAAVALVVPAALTLATGRPLATASFTRWDSTHYLGLAELGATLLPCGDRAPGDPQRMCGNSGWMPLYPMLVRALHHATGGHVAYADAAWLLSVTAWALAVATWTRRGWIRTPEQLALVTVFPGFVFHLAVYPVSLFVLLATEALHRVASGQPRRAALAGAFAGAAYTSGFILAAALPCAAWAVGPRGASGARRAALLSVAPLVGIAATAAYFHAATGHALALVEVQAKYGHHASAPWLNLARHLATKPVPVAAQTALAGALVVAALHQAFRRWDELTWERAFVPYIALYWLAPLTAGAALSLHRAEALLVPTTFLLGRAPRAVVVGAAAAALLAGQPMLARFFDGHLP